MPGKKQYGKKQRKPSMAKAKKMVTKQRAKKAKKNMDTFFFKSKVEATITPRQALAPGVSNYIYNAFTLDPTGPNAAYMTNAEFNLYRGMYDKFRVNSVKVTFIPKANVLGQDQAQNDALNNSGDGKIHHCIDRDSVGPSSIARIARYPSYRATSVLKKFSRTYSVKYPMGVWLDCDAPANFSMAKELGLQGGITIYAENLIEDNSEIFNEPWAGVLVEHNIVFQGKTSGQLTGVYDASENLIGVTLGYTSNDPNQDMTPLTSIRGTLNDKRLSNTDGVLTEELITDSATA